MGSVDAHFAGLLERLAEQSGQEVMIAAWLVSRRTGEGHTCVDLAGLAGKPVPGEWNGTLLQSRFPEFSRWQDGLAASGVVGRPGACAPLILDARGRLYLQKYWQYEQAVTDFVRLRGLSVTPPADLDLLRAGFDRYFSDQVDGLDWQKIAALVALSRQFSVITGGPGTGKTTTVAKILALLVEQSPGTRIALAAPTGKAAARLQEAIRSVMCHLPVGDDVKRDLPSRAFTLHRLLGARPGSPFFRYHAGNRLPHDVVVVDEASMIDLPLMAKLMAAIPAGARLLLLGDRGQLASVEPGSVLGDLCPASALAAFSKPFCQLALEVAGMPIVPEGSGGEGPMLCDAVVALRKNFRFTEHSGIHAASQAIHRGDAAAAFAVLSGGTQADIIWRDLPSPGRLEGALSEMLGGDLVSGGMPPVGEDAFALLSRSRLLCALRKGPFGLETVNRLVRHVLVGKGVAPPGSGLYPGLPLMVTRNDYALQLFNGDIGVVMEDREIPGGMAVVFQQEGTTGCIKVAPPLLPPHEPVYAMTVHKSQGLEFDRVCLLLPDRISPVLTRELIYTALTRARHSVEVWGRQEVFEEAVALRVARDSGLSAALWEGPD